MKGEKVSQRAHRPSSRGSSVAVPPMKLNSVWRLFRLKNVSGDLARTERLPTLS